jgi:hypothetical protein
VSENSGTDRKFLTNFTMFVQILLNIGMDSNTAVCNSLPKVMQILGFNSIHLCLQESSECKVRGFEDQVIMVLTPLGLFPSYP